MTKAVGVLAYDKYIGILISALLYSVISTVEYISNTVAQLFY